MKKICLGFFTVLILIFAVVFVMLTPQEVSQDKNDYLRIHVRANSNSAVDQDIKYKVKDEVVKFITPYAAQCVDKDTAKSIIGGILKDIEKVCDRVLSENGFTYTSRASVRDEEFPTRVYGDLTLEHGVYDALIIELGEGVGDNWWCVIYPPLCFTSPTTDIKYRSLIYDIIHNFFGK
ncbi:MAG: stage II sporulation protein R [Clostridiales bacterium]|nr:stage II sporulation protein R [Clostridiales bacterium]